MRTFLGVLFVIAATLVAVIASGIFSTVSVLSIAKAAGADNVPATLAIFAVVALTLVVVFDKIPDLIFGNPSKRKK